MKLKNKKVCDVETLTLFFVEYKDSQKIETKTKIE